MDKIDDYADSEGSSEQKGETGTMSKVGVLSLELSAEPACSKPPEETLPSSSWGPLKSYFVAMGFLPTLVDKVIEENGEGDVDLLLETLFTYSALQKSSSELSDSPDGILSPCKDEITSPVELSTCSWESEELDVANEVNSDKKSSLLMMKFSAEEVDSALNRLGNDAPITELVDFIISSQTAGSCVDKDIDDPIYGFEEKDEAVREITTETLFGEMDKTLRLLEMGFSQDEISAAIDRFGSEVPVMELADSIFAHQIAETSVHEDKDPSKLARKQWLGDQNDPTCLHGMPEERMKRCYSATQIEETEGSSSSFVPHVKDKLDLRKLEKGKKAKHMAYDDSTAFFDPQGLKEGKVESKSPQHPIFSPYSVDSKAGRFESKSHQFPSFSPELPEFERSRSVKLETAIPSRNLHHLVAKPPYFLYGNVVDISQDTWTKISQFLYAIEPEYVNSQFFSAFNRKEGYIHNLPRENRFHIDPRPPTTVEDAIPHTKNWWPSWDTRKQLSCINTEMTGISQLCERLGKILINSQGLLSKEQQTDILHQCKTLNLVWVGQYQLGPIEPDHVEHILGYPSRHTQTGNCEPAERLKLLKNSFQTDTLGYHLSVLRDIFPDGLTVLSIFSGIGGAEISLHRLGLRLKNVVSVEASRMNREILRRWWYKTGQTGELVQYEDVQRLTSQRVESLIKQFGGFDIVIGGNPCSFGSSYHGECPVGLDFPQFYEFVRVLQRVRDMMSRNS